MDQISPLRILLADDHSLFREALAEWLKQLNSHVEIQHAKNSREAIACLGGHSYHLVLIDLNMPGMEGVVSIHNICRIAGNARVVVISAIESPTTIRSCMETGIAGYIPKSSNGKTTVEAIKLIIAGNRYFPEQPDIESVGGWSKKQLQLITCLAEGRSNREIAERLHLSEGTVKQYVSRILTKLEVTNRTQAGIKARSILDFQPYNNSEP